MTTRLFLFFFFLALLVGALSLSSYKKVFNKDEKIGVAMIAESEALLKAKNNPAPKVVKKEEDKQEKYVLVIETEEQKLGQKIYTESGQCITCHGENGQGNPEEQAPLIAGQFSWYVTDQLQQMKSGKRNNEKMLEYVQNLSVNDMKAVAAYIELLRVR
jgi:cytochrome c553